MATAKQFYFGSGVVSLIGSAILGAVDTYGRYSSAKSMVDIVPEIGINWLPIYVYIGCAGIVTMVMCVFDPIAFIHRKINDRKNSAPVWDMPAHEAVNHIKNSSFVRYSLNNKNPLEHSLAILLDSLKIGDLKASYLKGAKMVIADSSDFIDGSAEFNHVQGSSFDVADRNMKDFMFKKDDKIIMRSFYLDRRDVYRLWPKAR